MDFVFIAYTMSEICIAIQKVPTSQLLHPVAERLGPETMTTSGPDMLHTRFSRLTVKDIKADLRARSVKFKSNINKKELYRQLLDEVLSDVLSDPAVRRASLVIQKSFRGWKVRERLRVMGPASFNRSLCNNTVDPVTMSDIADIGDQHFFSYRDLDGKIYGFDISSIAALVQRDMHENPFNRIPFSQVMLEKVGVCQGRAPVTGPETGAADTMKLTPEEAVSAKAFELFHNFYLLTGCFVEEAWFLDLDRNGLTWLYRRAYDLWRFRTHMTAAQRRNYIPGRVRVLNRINDVWYRQLFNSLKIQQLLLHDFELLTTLPPDREDRCTAVYWVLTALCQVSPAAANALPHLVM